MPAIASLLIVLTPEDRDQFFPDPLFAEITELSERCVFCDPSGLKRDDFAALLMELRPEVVLGGWTMPVLPAVLPPELRYICYLAGSVRRLVTREQIEAGLILTNWGDSISRTVAEAALLHILSCLRFVPAWHRELHDLKKWTEDGPIARSLFCRSVGIHSFGQIARELVVLLRPFHCSVNVYSQFLEPDQAAALDVRLVPSLEELFAENDIIVELSPLLPSTRGLVTEPLLRSMKPGAVLVNVGRADVIDQGALLRVLQESRISAGLDVHSPEPLPADSPLRGLMNVSLSPHNAGPTVDRRRDSGAFALRNLRAYRDRRPLNGVITLPLYDNSTVI